VVKTALFVMPLVSLAG